MEPDLAALIARARRLAASGGRRVLGIAGPPAAGKSTLAARVADALGPEVARLVGMDAFHYAQVELARLGRSDRKGAPDTFDADGYVALLERLRTSDDPIVYAPEFRREIEEPIACAVPVPRDVPLVVTEGNYLLVDALPWARVRPLLDEAWYIEPGDDPARVTRLIDRHVAFGRTPGAAREWVLRSDERNAELIARTAGRADLVVRW
jgi:pantothenate kinase